MAQGRLHVAGVPRSDVLLPVASLRAGLYRGTTADRFPVSGLAQGSRVALAGGANAFGPAATQLLPLVEQQPAGLRGLRYLPDTDSALAACFDEWHDTVPAAQRSFVEGARAALTL